MPLIKIDHIVSFSTEDSVHVANNILSSDASKKWKCKTAGEKTAVVVLQLEKASVITGIDIGNEHSAYIEVLVSRSGTSDDYKVLLVMSAFMTPLESRQSQNVNKVRMFTKDQLSSPECDEKWDRIKIVCTQPFNKHVQYGLSFVNFHTSEATSVVTSGQAHIGKFLVRPDSPDDISVGSLFSKRKDQKKEEKLTGVAAIREAGSSSSLALHGSPVCKAKLKIQESVASLRKQTTTSINSDPSHSIDSNDSEVKPSRKHRLRDEILYSKDEEEPNDKIDKIMDQKTKEAEETKAKAQSSENDPKKKHSLTKDLENQKKKEKEKERKKEFDASFNGTSKKNTPNNSREKDKELKRKNKDHSEDRKQKKIKKDRITKPFARLLEGVTIVISGIQNPDRANLRALALSMGAKYKADWGDNCTHLICAFTNTPKFNQVKGKGKIVKRTWVEDCHSQRKRLPWRRYALDKNDSSKAESEDEIFETVVTQKPSDHRRYSETGSDDNETNSFSDNKEDASDTEERLARIVVQRNQKRKDDQKKDSIPNIYAADTDQEDDCDDVMASEKKYKLLDIFDEKTFYIDQTFEEEKYNKLKKYIIAYKGTILDSPTDDVDIIITSRLNSNTVKEINSEAQVVSPNWVWKCHNSQKLVLIDDYLL